MAIVKATGQWMKNKVVAEYAENPVELIGAIRERQDPTHSLAHQNALDESNIDSIFKSAHNLGWRGLRNGSPQQGYNQAWNMAEAGTDRTQVVSEVREAANNFHNTMGAMKIGFIEEPAVSGGRLDPSKAITNDPKPFVRQVPKVTGVPFVHIAVDCGLLYHVSAETIIDRATLIAEAIVRAELGGYKTRVTALTATVFDTDSLIAVMVSNLKREDEPINYSRVLYPLLEPSFLRVLSFSWRSTLPELHDSMEYGLGASLYARFPAEQRTEFYGDVLGPDTLVFNLGSLCEDMDHDEAKQHIADQLETRAASSIDGKLRQFNSYIDTAEGREKVAEEKANGLLAAAQVAAILIAGDPEEEEEEEDPWTSPDGTTYKIEKDE